MAFFRPRVSREAEVRYHADQEIAKSFPELLEKARQAERTLQELRAADADEFELREAGLAFDRALTEALRAAEAGQRATFGVKAYDDRIARRKAKATPKGAMWTAEVNRLRTLREENRLWGIPRVPQRVPASR
jgi:O6-methylguanine-DNA--protein-cysteine methyltransferase